MQAIIVEKPYKFVPPHRGNWVPSLIQTTRACDIYLKRFEGIESFEIRGLEHLRESLADGHGILLAPNHCRYADPIAIGWLARAAKTHVYAMASWHLFNQHWLQSFAIRMCGGFSVYREGLDRKSLDTSIAALVDAERPLVLFPEGTVFRSNDIVQPLLDGISFLARSAARKREKKHGGNVVVHPIAIKYLLRDDISKVCERSLRSLEERFLTVRRTVTESMVARARRVSDAMLALREIACLGSVQTGTECQRRHQLVQQLIGPHEKRLSSEQQVDARTLALLPRIKQVRTSLVAQLRTCSPDSAEYKTVWKGLEDLYVAQQIGSHPVHYLDEPTDTRLLETIERIEEDTYDKSTIHRPLHAVLQVGPPVVVSPERPNNKGEDPLIRAIHSSLSDMLAELGQEARPIKP